MRELRENVRYRPARDRYKIFIIDEAHQITSEAFNALLKTLEEPPSGPCSFSARRKRTKFQIRSALGASSLASARWSSTN